MDSGELERVYMCGGAGIYENLTVCVVVSVSVVEYRGVDVCV